MAINVDLNMTRSLFVKINLRLLLKNWGIYAWIGVSLAFAVFVFWGFGQNTTSLVAACILFPVLLLVGFSFPMLNILSQARSPRNAGYFAPMHLSFDESGVITTSAKGQGKMLWKSFIYWKKAAGCYILVISKSAFIAIPQSAVPADRVGDFEALLHDRVNA